MDAYLSAIRLGQSKRGSFVLSLLSPWDFEAAQNAQTSLLEEVPFGRQVTRTLARDLSATRRAMNEAVSRGAGEAFREASLSINWCDALAALAREGEGIDISVSWSLTRPEVEVPVLRLRRTDAQILVEAKDFLKRARPIPDTLVRGFIVGIADDYNSFDGSAIIYSLVGDVFKKVRVKFGDDLRVSVFDAAKARALISVVGDLLTRPSGRSELLSPRDFSVIEADDDNESSLS